MYSIDDEIREATREEIEAREKPGARVRTVTIPVADYDVLLGQSVELDHLIRYIESSIYRDSSGELVINGSKLFDYVAAIYPGMYEEREKAL